MKAIILAGGKGKRLAPYTTVIPKPLMPVGHMPILEILIRRLKIFGIEEITLCVGYLCNFIQAYFGDGHQLGVHLTYSREDVPLGTAGPIRLLGLKDEFIVMNGDLLTTFDFNKFINQHKQNKSVLSIGAYQKEVNIDLGILKLDQDTLVEYIEKPTLHHWVSMGIYLMDPSMIELIPEGYFDLPDLVRVAIAQKQNISVYREPCVWLDIGRKDDYDYANETYGDNVEMFYERVASHVEE